MPPSPRERRGRPPPFLCVCLASPMLPPGTGRPSAYPRACPLSSSGRPPSGGGSNDWFRVCCGTVVGPGRLRPSGAECAPASRSSENPSARLPFGSPSAASAAPPDHPRRSRRVHATRIRDAGALSDRARPRRRRRRAPQITPPPETAPRRPAVVVGRSQADPGPCPAQPFPAAPAPGRGGQAHARLEIRTAGAPSDKGGRT